MNQLSQAIYKNAADRGDEQAYRFCWRKDGEWLPTTWSELATQIDVAARALCVLGIREGDRIAICSPNTPQILITEFGAYLNRASAIPIYAASSEEQLSFICTDGLARLLFIGDKGQYATARAFMRRHPGIVKRLIVYKNAGFEPDTDDTATLSWDDFVRAGMEAGDDIRAEVERRAKAAVPSDMATLIYTSGTTGRPKGVRILHSNYDAAMAFHRHRLTNVHAGELSMAFLPMSHILEKAWGYFCITMGVTQAINYDPRVIQETIHDVEPNLMCCVPRFWEKVYLAVKERLAAMSAPQRLAVRHAMYVGKRRNLYFRRLGKRVPGWLESLYRFYDKRVFLRLRKAIGIPDPNMFPTAGAPLSPTIVEFFRSVGIDVVIGYGLSETTATVTCFPAVGYEIGTVGTPLEGVQVRIADNGEILVKGPTVTPGYYNNEQANAEAFTTDGFFRTGDAGYLDDSGALILTERIKDLFKTANGKYIAPQALESMLAEDPYIDEAAVIGDGKKYVSALIVPNYVNLRRWAEGHGITASSTETLVNDPAVEQFVFGRIERMQSRLPAYERIKRIRLLPHHFSIMNGEVTNTMKVRRPVVARRYAAEISSMYPEG